MIDNEEIGGDEDVNYSMTTSLRTSEMENEKNGNAKYRTNFHQIPIWSMALFLPFEFSISDTGKLYIAFYGPDDLSEAIMYESVEKMIISSRHCVAIKSTFTDSTTSDMVTGFLPVTSCFKDTRYHRNAQLANGVDYESFYTIKLVEKERTKEKLDFSLLWKDVFERLNALYQQFNNDSLK